MQHGDISNEVPPRFLFVFEGLVASLPNAAVAAQERTYCRLHQWRRAAGCWRLNETIVDHLWDLTWRHDYRYDIVTWHDEKFVESLALLLDHHGLPFGNIISSTPDALAHKLAHMPDVMSVFFADERLIFRFGAKGRIVRFQGVGFSPFV